MLEHPELLEAWFYIEANRGPSEPLGSAPLFKVSKMRGCLWRVARTQVIALFFGKREPSSQGNARLIQLTHELRTVRVQVWDVESDARVQRCQVRDYAGLREQG